MSLLVRRCLLIGLVFGFLGLAAGSAKEVQPVVKPQAREFPLSAVKLLDGPFKQAMEVDKAYLLRLDPDRLLAGYRIEAGLPKKAAPYGGWESIPAKGRFSLTGFNLGHYLSALSMMAQAAGDSECRRRVDYIVEELAACQKASGDGSLNPFPQSKQLFAEISSGNIKTDRLFMLNGGYVPLYNLHKVMAGLRRRVAALGTPPSQGCAGRHDRLDERTFRETHRRAGARSAGNRTRRRNGTRGRRLCHYRRRKIFEVGKTAQS